MEAQGAAANSVDSRRQSDRGRLLLKWTTKPYDPRVLARRHYHENLWLRSILENVARELERMAARGQGDPRVLLGRAQRVRQRLHEGVPAGWTAGR